MEKCKKTPFFLFPIVLYREYTVKHVCRYPDLFLGVPDHETWHETSLSYPKLTMPVWLGYYFFGIKVTR